MTIQVKRKVIGSQVCVVVFFRQYYDLEWPWKSSGVSGPEFDEGGI